MDLPSLPCGRSIGHATSFDRISTNALIPYRATTHTSPPVVAQGIPRRTAVLQEAMLYAWLLIMQPAPHALVLGNKTPLTATQKASELFSPKSNCHIWHAPKCSVEHLVLTLVLSHFLIGHVQSTALA